MNRRRTQAILKVTLCALLVPGCASPRLFQKNQSLSKDASKKGLVTPNDTAARTWPDELTGEDLIPVPPGSRIIVPPSDTATLLQSSPAETPAIVQIAGIETGPESSKTTKPATDDPLLLALACMLNNRHNDALQHLESFDSATQELLLRLLPMLATLKKKGLDKLSRDEVGTLHEQLEGLLNTLRPRTDLVIEKICCCEWIKGYGDYGPLPEKHAFRPGEFVWLYVELRNFCAENRDAFCETRLSNRVKIHDPKNAAIKPHEFALDETQPGNRVHPTLHAYYQIIRFPVPSLPAGVYTLTLHVTDESQFHGARVAEKSMEFRVTNAPARAP